MRRYRFPLLVREVGIARRTLVATTALLCVALLALYATFDPANRYRILADPTMARSLLLPAALLIGALCAWQSFVGEMRSGTWEGWLLLPRSRGALVMSKVGVGLASITLALLAPVATLWLVMRLAGGLGGPLVGPVDLLVRSSFSQALVVAWSTYLAVANAALLARDGQIAFLAPLLLPLVATARFFVGQDGVNGLSGRAVTLGWLGASMVMLALLMVSLLRSGRPSSGLEAGLRATLLTPAAGLAVLVVGVIGYESKARVFPERREVPTESEPRTPKPYLRQDGLIRADADERRTSVSMYALRRETGDNSRLHVQVLSNSRMQLFQHESRPLLRAFDVASGDAIGCVGTNGLRACEVAGAPWRRLRPGVRARVCAAAHPQAPMGRARERAGLSRARQDGCRVDASARRLGGGQPRMHAFGLGPRRSTRWPEGFRSDRVTPKAVGGAPAAPWARTAN